MPSVLFFFEVSKVCFICSEMLHSTSYSALLSSYTSEINSWRKDRQKKSQPFTSPRAFGIYFDRQTQIHYSQKIFFDVSSEKKKWDIQHRGRVIFVNRIENLTVINRRLTVIYQKCNK